ncbi:hydroxyproline-rich glycoprotein family protein [Abeliophyllum distichum]|uniref:Hydroxyproline-rich glycoprotein family protein n=1 Tax=Abeliophyllum distichum TaxID=126358 RepID=A0ABD1TI57_9LAMI
MGTDEHEINKKRKIDCQDFQISRAVQEDNNNFSTLSREDEQEKNKFLALSLATYHPSNKPRQLSPGNHHPRPPQSPLPRPLSLDNHPVLDELVPSHYSLCIPPPPVGCVTLGTSPPVAPIVPYKHRETAVTSAASTGRVRRNPSQSPRQGKSATVPPPFPWATNQRATVYSLNYLLSENIFTITGDVQCKRCEQKFSMEYDLQQKFIEVGSFIAKNRRGMHDRAPGVWINPNLPTCRICKQENSVKPIISEKKKSINWLFLLLGQMLGCCTLEQLKYFCKHTKNHRTGAKDRVLYLTYLGLCKQLDPNGPFDR